MWEFFVWVRMQQSVPFCRPKCYFVSTIKELSSLIPDENKAADIKGMKNSMCSMRAKYLNAVREKLDLLNHVCCYGQAAQSLFPTKKTGDKNMAFCSML